MRNTNPSKMYSTLKRLGSRPGNNEESNSFSLPLHVEQGYSAEQSAELIANHFAAISQEYRPLDVSSLPL